MRERPRSNSTVEDLDNDGLRHLKQGSKRLRKSLFHTQKDGNREEKSRDLPKKNETE